MTTSACVCRSALINTRNVRNKNTRRMKQTNNAIKFLMAQYRAIFKNAYFKGIASAMLLTAGLAVAGSAQAATNIDETHWGSLTTANGVTTVTGTDADDGTSGNYTDFSFKTTTGKYETEAVQNILIKNKSGGNSVEAVTGGPMEVIGTNTTITLSGDTATNAALSIKASGANAASLSVDTFNVGVGELTISGASTGGSGAATLKANTINLAGGNGSKITLNGTAGSGAAVLQGQLTSNNITDPTELTEIVFSGTNNILQTYGSNLQVKITAATQTGATLDLTPDTGVDATEENQLLQITGGTIDLQGHASNSGGYLTIKNGTLEIGDDVVLTNSTESTKAGQLIVSGAAATDNATLRISSEKLKSFLAADGQSPDKSGAVTVNSGSIYLTDSTKSAVDLADGFTFAISAVEAGGSIALTTDADSIIAGDKLAVSKKLTGDASKATIEATTLTLGSETFNSATDDAFGFASATTQSLNLVQSGSGAFVLKDAITLKAATQEVDNIYTTNVSGDKITIAGNGGNIANTDLKLNGGSTDALTIAAGHYTGNVDVEISSGSLSVGLGATNAESQGVKGVDASLTFAAGTTLTLDNKTNTNTITVQGNGDATWDGVTV